MSALSDSAEAIVLNYLMTTGSTTRPTAWFLGLFTSATTDAGGGNEVSGNNYTRQAVTFAAATSPGGTTTSTNSQTFAAIGGNWGTITHVAIMDAASSGNMIWHGAIAVNRIVNDGDTMIFAIGEIDLTLG